jgi:hypothetical protein
MLMGCRATVNRGYIKEPPYGDKAVIWGYGVM